MKNGSGVKGAASSDRIDQVRNARYADLPGVEVVTYIHAFSSLFSVLPHQSIHLHYTL